ncbi:hypothetical protein CcaverHIS002_0701620 [Cutaneotrichosporon cavernicola]|uniref:glucan 1,3-beta-glucosidase n=1 Tax=Cutaneotrichosporon cavernicola TaxID=279322 RepID=A0AA48QYQ7_9TREE|nr:uncharacterized protein CcaverHIS019_0701650 [Cutaneotrichosporon cavernicola]BEI86816.1 hypothetical protein CcaverHIS002_0701620 [Cutaneotrichosporon cavernicola]BEI94593.1 hypothetical protein CcaverHIS019_0701650 [Cutaneotrichosporon cavernicola]BEJ02370.1 hypothetical protein CcaverHIS631_0701650 [Cutaneotrichosporon cavernicola]BEJ10127.1 hypothetical protein CcaverHIS641_0701620 [Cutaneotrichosporon cavernicola]
MSQPSDRDLGDRNSGGFHSAEAHEMADTAYLGPAPGPSPSVFSRDSTYTSLAPSERSHGARDSWGSNKMMASGEAPIAGSALPTGAAAAYAPRQQSQLQHGYTSPYDSETVGSYAPAGSVPTAPDYEKTPAWAAQNNQRKRKSRWWLWALLALICLICAGVGLGVGLGLGLNKKSGASSDSAKDKPMTDVAGHTTGAEKPSATDAPTAAAIPTSGGFGSIITLDDGTNMTYENEFGGHWYWDPADPFNNNAQANSWTKPLNQSWDWEKDTIFGVNLGGWLNTEPFIVPGLYERYSTGPAGTTVDEYTLSINMGTDLEKAMTEHYDTFITERDFMEITAAGLNWIRLPIAHWAIYKDPSEPYLERVSWTYVLKALGWARKYGIRVNLDLHTAPGSQNGWNHSGKIGAINWMKGAMGLANAQRTLETIRTIAQFISTDEWKDVVPMFCLLNEPNGASIDQANAKRTVGTFTYEAYKTIRAVTGYGEGKGPMIAMHDAFLGVTEWFDYLRGADRLAMDQHQYLVFQDQLTGQISSFQNRPCDAWADRTAQTTNTFGANNAGEWSAAVNDCGQWLNGVGLGSRYDGTFQGYADKRIGSCDFWNDYTQWDQATKDGLREWVASSMDAFQNYFFWTWRIGNGTTTVPSPNPMWHYRLGWKEGWIAADPRTATGTCAKAGVSVPQFGGTFSDPAMVGKGQVSPDLPAAQTASYAWPPTQFTDISQAQMNQIPQYTKTGTPITMPGPTYTNPAKPSETINAGTGWANSNDGLGQAYVKVANCEYPAIYDTVGGIGAGQCGAGGGDGGGGAAASPPATPAAAAATPAGARRGYPPRQ